MFGHRKKAPKAGKETSSEGPKRQRDSEENLPRDIDVQEYMRRLVNDSE